MITKIKDAEKTKNIIKSKKKQKTKKIINKENKQKLITHYCNIMNNINKLL